MDQTNNQQVSDFEGFVINPASLINADVQNLETLIEKFPYCQLLHSFYSKALFIKKDEAYEPSLQRSALYAPDRKILHAIINKPETLISLYAPIDEVDVETPSDSRLDQNSSVIDNEEEVSFEEVSDVTIEQPLQNLSNHSINELGELESPISLEGEEELIEKTITPEALKEDELRVEEENIQHPETDSKEETLQEEALKEDELRVEEENIQHPETDSKEETLQEEALKEDELQVEEENIQHPELVDNISSILQKSAAQENDEVVGEKAKDKETIEEEKLIFSSITSSDFFAVEEKLDAIKDTLTNQAKLEALVTNQKILEQKGHVNSHSTEKQVSKYDDDQMPYTFLWWLNKTRKEHAETYQPYVSHKSNQADNVKKLHSDELNHQIIENIFHLQSPIKVTETKLLEKKIPLEFKRKEEEIIEKFIKEEPQIKPPKPENLTMENKAKKSAEDPNDLVSETLASIYTDQMLFHKAIDTYKKLSLKFPEKRAYFADQILELEKKIN